MKKKNKMLIKGLRQQISELEERHYKLHLEFEKACEINTKFLNQEQLEEEEKLGSKIGDIDIESVGDIFFEPKVIIFKYTKLDETMRMNYWKQIVYRSDKVFESDKKKLEKMKADYELKKAKELIEASDGNN